MDDVREFAARAHASQRYGDRPYSVHLEAVEQVLIRFGISDPALLCAAWLHDAVEDTDTPIEEIRIRYGARVAELVLAVSDEPGGNRKERKAKTYPKILRTKDAVILKLADRIANVEDAAKNRADRFAMYQAEQDAFAQALRQPGIAEELWQHLDGLFAGGFLGSP